MLGILYVLRALSDKNEDRIDQIRFIKRTLWEIYESNPVIARFMDGNRERFNAESGNPASWAALEDLLSEQLYRLSFWKTATEEINYRRFFNVNDLICVRVEDEDVFQETHALLFRLLEEGKVDGIRIDHVDGLYEPARYLNRLRYRAGDIDNLATLLKGISARNRHAVDITLHGLKRSLVEIMSALESMSFPRSLINGRNT
ncbi:MAG: hypothetical protein ACOWYE_01755 [Desulfatiglandales bacterium]